MTTQEIMHDKPPISGFPVRKWSVAVAMDDGNGNEVAPPFIDRVIFKLHPTFANPNKSESSLATSALHERTVYLAKADED